MNGVTSGAMHNGIIQRSRVWDKDRTAICSNYAYPYPFAFHILICAFESYSCRQISSNQFGNTCDLGSSFCCSGVRLGEPDSVCGCVNARPLYYFITHWTLFNLRGNGHFATGSSNYLLCKRLVAYFNSPGNCSRAFHWPLSSGQGGQAIRRAPCHFAQPF